MPFRSLTNCVGVADEHDRQPVRADEPPRDALDVVGRHRPHALAGLRQVVDRQPVEELVEHLRGDRVRRLDGQREVAHHVVLRALAVPLRRHARAAAARTRRRPRAAPPRCSGLRVGLRDDGARHLVGVEVGGGAVGQLPLRAEHLLQPVGALAAQDLHGLIDDLVVGVLAGHRPGGRRGSPSAPASFLSITITRRVGAGGSINFTAGNSRRLPRAEVLLEPGHGIGA